MLDRALEVAEGRIPVGITGDSYAATSQPPYRVLQAGVDQIEIRLDLEGSITTAKLDRWDTRPASYGRVRLGHVGEFGKWEPLLGRSVMFKPDTKRLWIDVHPHGPGELCGVHLVYGECVDLLEKFAVLGISSHHEPVVSRLDVTVDLITASADAGRALMVALAEGRLDRGRSVEVPYSDLRAVYGRSRGENAPREFIVYDKGLERGYEKLGRNRWLRLEARRHWKGRDCPTLEEATTVVFMRDQWVKRFSGVSGGRAVVRGAAMTVTEMLREGEISTTDGERLLAFLELERLGVAEEVYPPRLLRERRKLAREFGVAAHRPGDEGESVSLDLQGLLGEWSESI